MSRRSLVWGCFINNVKRTSAVSSTNFRCCMCARHAAPGTIQRTTHFFFFFFSHTVTFQLLDNKRWSQVGVVPSPPQFLPSIFIAHRVQQSHCSSIFHRVLLTYALALSASQFVHKKKSQRIYTRMHSAGLELTKLTYEYTRLEDNLIRHRGNRQLLPGGSVLCVLYIRVGTHGTARG